MLEARYKRDGERLALYMGDECLYVTEEIAIVFDDDFVLLKHGDYDLVYKWFVAAYLMLRWSGNPRLAEGLRMISSSEWDPDELTKIVNNTGYIKQFLEANIESHYRETRVEPPSC